MIRFFRRALSSWLVLGLFGLIMLAFVITGIGDPRGGFGQSGPTDSVASIGNEDVSVSDAIERIRLAQQNAQQSQPDMTMPMFIEQGGADAVVRDMINNRALEAWARDNGIVAGKRLVDGEIASIAAFRGPTGQFDEGAFRAVLAQRRISESYVRNDIASGLIRRQLFTPLVSSYRTPTGVALPYAELLLELRKGRIAVVPAALMPQKTMPNDAEINAWYTRNLARYTLPERRVIRYALIGKDQLPAATIPSEADIAAAYKADAARYGAKETRSFSQVILPVEAAAKTLHAKIKAGTSFADAARKAGFAPADTVLGEQTRAQISGLGTTALANAAFTARQGETIPPVKSALGWHVLHVDSVRTTASRPLAEVRAEIVAQLEKAKAEDAITDLIGSIETDIADGASFDEVIKARKLQVVTSPAVTAAGTIPGNPAPLTDPVLATLLKTAFEMSSDDDPSVEVLGDGQIHVLLKVVQVIPSAPMPLAQVRDRAKAEFIAARALKQARALAETIKAKTDKGMPLEAALASAGTSAGVPLPPIQPAGGRQLDLMRARQGGQTIPAPVMALFSIKTGGIKLVAAPNGAGWFIVKLDSVEKGNIANAPGLVAATRNEFNALMAQELAEQFTNAATNAIGVKRNDRSVAKLKAQLTGGEQ